MRRRLLKLMAGAGAGAALHPVIGAAQAAYPTRPVTIVFPFSAGGSVDGMIRAVAEDLTQRMGQPFIVDSRPGAGSTIGAEVVARSTPDGHTLLWSGWNTLTTNLALYRNIRYKIEDFAPITSTFSGVIGLAVRPNIPASDFRQLSQHIQNTGGSLEYGTAGIGTSPHLLMQLAAKAAGIKLTMVPYKGEAQGVTDMTGGHLPMFAGSVSNMIEHHRAGALRLVGLSSPVRLEAYPGVPTFHEAGYPQLDFAYWHALLAPTGTPPAIVSKLNAAVKAAMGTTLVAARLSPDQKVTTSSPEELGRLIREDKQKWGDVIMENRLVAD